MRIRRLEASVAEDTGSDGWPELANVNLNDWPDLAKSYPQAQPYGGWSMWGGDLVRDVPAYLGMAVRADPTGATPEYYYMVELPGEEFGALLGGLQPESVPEVIDAFLRTASPELLGAVAGRIIAHVATVAGSRRVETGA